MTKTRKALFLSFGVAVGFAGLASASQRERDGAGTTEASTTTREQFKAQTPGVVTDAKLVRPGVAVGTVNGKQVEFELNKAVVSTADAAKQSGSLERYLFEMHQRNVPYFVGQDGERIYTNGLVGNFDDLLGSTHAGEVAQIEKQSKPPTVEDFKAKYRWVEVTTNGHSQLIFMTPLVLNDPAVMPAADSQLSNNVPSFMSNGRKTFASPLVFHTDEASSEGKK